MGRENDVKSSVLSKAIYKTNEILIIIPMAVFIEIERIMTKVM